MANSLATKLLRNPSLALMFAIAGAASMAYYHQGLFIPKANAMLAARGLANGYSFGNDFYQVWLTSRALFAQNPYSPEMTKEIQIGLYGRALDPNRSGDFVDQRVFPYPAFTDLLFWPTSRFAFPAVRIAVLIVLLPLTSASAMLWLNAMNWSLQWRWVALIALLTLSSYSALEGLYAAQLGLLVAFLLAATFATLNRERFLLAGLLLALTMMKPQVAFLPVIYLVLWASSDLRKLDWICRDGIPAACEFARRATRLDPVMGPNSLGVPALHHSSADRRCAHVSFAECDCGVSNLRSFNFRDCPRPRACLGESRG